MIYLKSQKGSLHQGRLRRITYRDLATVKRLTFLTNRFDLATQTICDLYKARWKVELEICPNVVDESSTSGVLVMGGVG
jgi:hypothetical protein